VSALTCREDVHGQLVVLGVHNRDDIERLFDLAGDLAQQELLQLQDAAYAYRDDKGKVRIHQAITLIGLLFLNPLAGLAIGAASGAVAGKLADVGINDDIIKQIASQPRGAGRRCLLARSATVDKVIAAVKPFNSTVIQTNLTKEREEELVRRCGR
jgi:uncharacterized membrane protein